MSCSATGSCWASRRICSWPDVAQIATYGMIAAMVLDVHIPWATLMLYFLLLVPVTVELVWAVLLSYAVLRAHLFDIDPKVKLALKGTTVTSVFVGSFLIVSQLVQNVTSQFLGYLGGAVAAGLLLFVLHPLQRAADRMANAAMRLYLYACARTQSPMIVVAVGEIVSSID